MKRIFKVLVNVMAVLMLSVFALGLFGCQDIKKLQVTVEVDEKEYTLSVDLYRHLAPNTVDAIVGYVNEGYYNGKVFYKFESTNNKQIMMGDLYFDESGAIQKAKKAEIKGEFTNNGVKGSDLISAKGYIGLWRTWYDYGEDNSFKKSDDARDSGSATWYMPTETTELSNYNGNFCVFAKFDVNDDANKNAYNALADIFASSDNYTTYVIYYTGEYDADKKDSDYGLEYHCITKEAYALLSAEEKEEIFATEDKKGQLVCYNATNVQVPSSAKVKSIKVA